jgi:hypothetical protein
MSELNQPGWASTVTTDSVRDAFSCSAAMRAPANGRSQVTLVAPEATRIARHDSSPHLNRFSGDRVAVHGRLRHRWQLWPS